MGENSVKRFTHFMQQQGTKKQIPKVGQLVMQTELSPPSHALNMIGKCDHVVKIVIFTHDLVTHIPNLSMT